MEKNAFYAIAYAEHEPNMWSYSEKSKHPRITVDFVLCYKQISGLSYEAALETLKALHNKDPRIVTFVRDYLSNLAINAHDAGYVVWLMPDRTLREIRPTKEEIKKINEQLHKMSESDAAALFGKNLMKTAKQLSPCGERQLSEEERANLDLKKI